MFGQKVFGQNKILIRKSLLREKILVTKNSGQKIHLVKNVDQKVNLSQKYFLVKEVLKSHKLCIIYA